MIPLSIESIVFRQVWINFKADVLMVPCPSRLTELSVIKTSIALNLEFLKMRRGNALRQCVEKTRVWYLLDRYLVRDVKSYFNCYGKRILFFIAKIDCTGRIRRVPLLNLYEKAWISPITEGLRSKSDSDWKWKYYYEIPKVVPG